jgi:hypothetical protein
MKNLHLLETDKLSRLFIEYGDLLLSDKPFPQTKNSNLNIIEWFEQFKKK